MRIVPVVLLSALLVVAPGCHAISEANRAHAIEYLTDARQRGEITEAQYNAGVEAIDWGGSFDWDVLGMVAANALLALVGGPVLVRYGIRKSAWKSGSGTAAT